MLGVSVKERSLESMDCIEVGLSDDLKGKQKRGVIEERSGPVKTFYIVKRGGEKIQKSWDTKERRLKGLRFRRKP